MRFCRFKHQGKVGWGLYGPEKIRGLNEAAEVYLGSFIKAGWECCLLETDENCLSVFWEFVHSRKDAGPADCRMIPTAEVELLPPITRPPKLLLLAGNYAEHVKEQGGVAAEKQRTFPYVFTKPASTTFIGSGAPFTIPASSPDKLDHEVELGVVIGRRIRNASLEEAQRAIFGYTVINDISDRGFRPNPSRETRPRDTFFDWLHGKWHDDSCPCGPCVVTADEIPDAQNLPLTLTIDGEVRQSGNTSQMIFSIAEVVQFISSFVTLEPLDVISTGTPSGVGNATGKYLKRGQNHGRIDRRYR